jgi:hypothetical protein
MKMHSTDNHRQQDIVYDACWRDAQSSESASAYVVGKYNNLEDKFMSYIAKWDYMRYMYLIDDHYRLPSMPPMKALINTKI